MEPLEPAQRRALRAKAHHLDPVVTIGHHGLTRSVRREIDLALGAHELVKVRVLGDDREARETLLARVCAELDCAPVQQIGKLLVLWRPKPAETAGRAGAVKRTRAPARLPTTSEAASRMGRRDAARPPHDMQPHAGAPAKPAATRAPRGVPRAALPRRRRGV